MALGAHPKDILQWITKLGLQLVAIGIVVGIALAVGLTRWISAVLFGVNAYRSRHLPHCRAGLDEYHSSGLLYRGLRVENPHLEWFQFFKF